MFSETIPFFPLFLHKVASNKWRAFLISARMLHFSKISVVDYWTFKTDLIRAIGSWIVLDTNIWFGVYIDPGLLFPHTSESCHLKWDNFTIHEILWSVCNKEEIDLYLLKLPFHFVLPFDLSIDSTFFGISHASQANSCTHLACG